MDPLKIEHKVVGARLDIDPSTRAHAEHFRLVEIAFERYIGHGQPDRTEKQLGERCVRYADAVLAAMDATPDTGPSAEEVQEEIIEIDEDGVVHAVGEKPNLAIVLAIRAQIQTQRDADLKADANYPTTNIRASGYRAGRSDARKSILEIIDAAMETTGDAVSPAHEIRPTRCEEDGGLLVDGE